MGLDEAAFLPFTATFARVVPRYVDWLHQRDREGAVWIDGEREVSASPPGWSGVQMYGVIDRIDRVQGEHGSVIQLIDYKTGSAVKLRSRVSDPDEDTQLAFYAALMAQQPEALAELSAVYLPLDEPDSIRAIEHPDVARTAERLVDAVGHDLSRLREGAVLQALGEGSACEFCEARGVCRRDHWQATDEASA
jgi:ATP-dependent helicase/nuclease subunit B